MIGPWLTSSKDSGAPDEVVRAVCALALATAATSTAPPMPTRTLHCTLQDCIVVALANLPRDT